MDLANLKSIWSYSVGLISKYGKDLVGRIFIYRNDLWSIGKVTKIEWIGRDGTWANYRSLVRSGGWLMGDPGTFAQESAMDRESKLIKSSSQFLKYLELFGGTN